MLDHITVRRRDDGSIDIDFYRCRATALRGQTMRKHAALRFACAGLLALGLCVAIVASAATPASKTTNSGVTAAATSPKL